MTKRIPANFRSVNASPLASYDSIDFLTGTGFVKFYGGYCAGSANNYTLQSNAFYSDFSSGLPHIKTKSANMTGSFTKLLDLDFDANVYLPCNLKGLLIVSVPLCLTGSGGPNTAELYPVVRLRKYDGTTETEVASADLSGDTSTTTLNEYAETRTVIMDVPLTHYKKGEKIRITIEAWAKSTGTSQINVYHDPAARSDLAGTFTAFTSVLQAFLPFKLNI